LVFIPEKGKSSRVKPARGAEGAAMHHVHQCSNCGGNVRPELGVASAVTVQHRECADRFGVGTHGKRFVLPVDDTSPHRPIAARGA
jgi:hypothetical protein